MQSVPRNEMIRALDAAVNPANSLVPSLVYQAMSETDLQRSEDMEWLQDSIDRYQQVRFHGLFLFLSTGDNNQFINNYLGDLHFLTQRHLDIHYCPRDLPTRTSGYEIVEKVGNLELRADQLPALLLWQGRMDTAKAIPLRDLQQQDVFEVVQVAVQAICDGFDLNRVVHRATLYAAFKQRGNREGQAMILTGVPIERISLIKEGDVRIDDISAQIGTELIVIDDYSLPIEEGDTLVRALPNNLTETYIVLDRGFQRETNSLSPHYEVKVRKANTSGLDRSQSTTIYHFAGANSRVNIHSEDNSVNVVNDSESIVFDEMRSAIRELDEDGDAQDQILQHIDALQHAQDSPSFLQRYTELIAIAADHMTVLAPFLPALYKMIIR